MPMWRERARVEESLVFERERRKSRAGAPRLRMSAISHGMVLIISLASAANAQDPRRSDARKFTSSGADSTFADNGRVWGVLPDGTQIIGVSATISVWPDDSITSRVFREACTAASSNPISWMIARTEFSAPSGVPPDSATQSDIRILNDIAQIPHGTGHANRYGSYEISHVSQGHYLLEAEVLSDGDIVQWWNRVTFPRTTGNSLDAKSNPSELGPANMAKTQFCSDSAVAAGNMASSIAKPPYSATRIYSVTEVDSSAKLVPGRVVAPAYPEELRAAALTGRVTVRFVVNADGGVEMPSVEVIHSNNPSFTTSVTAVLPRMKFVPASLDGHNVRQSVTEPFDFHILPTAIRR